MCFLSPSAISSLLASVTLDLSQYALDIGKGLAGECPDPSSAPRMTPWVFGCTYPSCRRRGKRQPCLEINYRRGVSFLRSLIMRTQSQDG